MDWNALKNKAVDLGNKAMDKSLSALEKASSHTYEGLKKTPVSIKNGAEFDDAKSAPLLMVVVVGKEDAASKSVLARMPVIFKDVWIYSASLKVVLADEVPELVSALQVSELPTVLVFRKGEQEKRFDGLAALDFIKCINLSRPKAEAAAVPEGHHPGVLQEGFGEGLGRVQEPACRVPSATCTRWPDGGSTKPQFSEAAIP